MGIVEDQGTSLLLHVSALQSLVQETNAKSDINAHPFFVDLPCGSVLYQYVCRVGTELIAAIRNLGDDF